MLSRARAQPTQHSALSTYNAARMTLDEQLAFLAKGAVDLIERNDLKAKLSRGRPLTVVVDTGPV